MQYVTPEVQVVCLESEEAIANDNQMFFSGLIPKTP